MVCTISKDLLITPGAKLRSVSRVVEELPRRVDSHDTTRQNLGVIEERFERCFRWQGADRARARRVIDRVVGYDE